jgi:saccharopine dehydrogenase-like NADP-dependent oxidoreductase
MTQQVLILGGQGRIGRQVAADLATYTQAEITTTGRRLKPNSQAKALPDAMQRTKFLALDLEDQTNLTQTIQALAATQDGVQKNVVVHCAGPFHYRDARVLKTCIEAGVNYVDVSDHPSFTRKAIAYQQAAADAGVTAIVNTGIFPGISNSMVRRDVERLDRVDRIHLSYVVAGSGGAGLTVMRTTFLGLQRPFQAFLNSEWQMIKPYSDREIVEFPAPYGRTGVYWFDMPETFTLPNAFPAKTVITKFGTVPDFYNYLTWWVAHTWHPQLLKQTPVIEFLSRVSHFMTDVTDRFSGIGVAIRSEVSGEQAGTATQVVSTLVHPNTAIAAACGTGSVVELLLTGQLQKPGVWAIEEALPTDLFEQTLASRGMTIQQTIAPVQPTPA